MAEYIDRDKVLAFQNELEPVLVFGQPVYSATKDADLVAFINDIPAADVVPVRHGIIVDMRKAEDDGEWKCTKCGWQYTVCVCGKDVTQKIHYCPNCGAKLDGKEDA